MFCAAKIQIPSNIKLIFHYFIYQKNRKKMFLYQKAIENIIFKAKSITNKLKENTLFLV